ncbi:unnamed protein product [Sphagnum tenellum]
MTATVKLNSAAGSSRNLNGGVRKRGVEMVCRRASGGEMSSLSPNAARVEGNAARSQSTTKHSWDGVILLVKEDTII